MFHELDVAKLSQTSTEILFPKIGLSRLNPIFLECGNISNSQKLHFSKIGLSWLKPIFFECAQVTPNFPNNYFDQNRIEQAQPNFFFRVEP